MKTRFFLSAFALALFLPLALFAEAGGGQVAAVPQSSGQSVVIMTTGFDGTNVLSVISSADFRTLMKNLPAENDAARKAYGKVMKAWNDKYDPPQNYQQNNNQGYEYRKVPPFPLKKRPVKEVKQLEVCKSEELANERLLFYEKRAAELELKAAITQPHTADVPAQPAIASGKTLGSTQAPGTKKTARPETIDLTAKAEVMQQFMDELKKLLAETKDANATSAMKKVPLGTKTTKAVDSSPKTLRGTPVFYPKK